ncbi:hypothetical protein B0H14DRAFT_2730145 [Mycena olivaceomarginata]|nr:hypothetical protein B0H14DRAFT_2730145 [Mycena olivaceomarginata]
MNSLHQLLASFPYALYPPALAALLRSLGGSYSPIQAWTVRLICNFNPSNFKLQPLLSRTNSAGTFPKTQSGPAIVMSLLLQKPLVHCPDTILLKSVEI